MKQVNKNPRLYLYLLIVVCLHFIWYIYIEAVKRNNYHKAKQNGQEAVAKIKDLLESRRGPHGNVLTYRFHVDNELFFGEHSFEDDTTYVYMTFDTTNIGRKFIVKYLPNNPDINVILLDREVK